MNILLKLTGLNQSAGPNDDDRRPPTEKWIIVFEGSRDAGVVKHYSDSRAVGVHRTQEAAFRHAQRLALCHPKCVYAVARVHEIVSSPDGLDAVRDDLHPNYQTVGDLYDAAGCGSRDRPYEEARGRLSSKVETAVIQGVKR